MTTAVLETPVNRLWHDGPDEISDQSYHLAAALVACAKIIINVRAVEIPEIFKGFVHSMGGSHPESGELRQALDDQEVEALDLLADLLTVVIRTYREEAIERAPTSIDVKMETPSHPRSAIYYLSKRAFAAQGWGFSIVADSQGGWIWNVRLSRR